MLEWVFRKSIGGRKDQQDNGCVLSRDSLLLAAVADGLGGHSGAKHASAAVAEEVRRAFELDFSKITDLSLWVRNFYSVLKRAVQKKQEKHRCDAMTTVVFLLLWENQAYWFHLGDSRLYFFRNGEFTRTKDHSQVQKMLDLGQITEEEMGHHSQQNILLGCLGSESSSLPSFHGKTLEEKDVFLLCTDGFWEYFSRKEMLKFLFSRELKKEADRVMEIVLKRGGARGDNVSFIAVRKL